MREVVTMPLRIEPAEGSGLRKRSQGIIDES
jgi:hypothetical protein